MKFQFETLSDFFIMNGHGPYVWASYIIAAIGLVYLLVSPLLEQKKFIEQQKKIQILEERLARE